METESQVSEHNGNLEPNQNYPKDTAKESISKDFGLEPEHLKHMNKCMSQILDTIMVDTRVLPPTKGKDCKNHWVNLQKDLASQILEFMEHAKKLELAFASIQSKYYWGTEVQLEEEIEDLEKQLNRKNDLLKKYKSKVDEWEQTYRQTTDQWQV